MLAWDWILPVLGLLVRWSGSPALGKDRWTGRIRCPRCAWQPGREDRWSCGPGGCGHVWNTFETAGRCPACDRKWTDTACLRCGQWSPHEEWYEGQAEG